MNHYKDRTASPPETDDGALLIQEHEAVVSWGAVLAGGICAAAFALILLTLGTGLGLTAISPWSSTASNAKAFGFAAVVWVCVTSILTSGLGGYLAGRMRRRWRGVSADEVHFRDTAHGFLSWAVATLLTAGILSSAISGAAHVGTQVAASDASEVSSNATLAMQRGNAIAALNTWPLGYLVDSLFRTPAGSQPAHMASNGELPRQQAALIFMNSAATGAQLSPEDRGYMSWLVVQQTGLPATVAQDRVTATYANLLQKMSAMDDAAKAAADKARKVTVGAALWLFVSLLMGAFSASLLAVHGGRVRQI